MVLRVGAVSSVAFMFLLSLVAGRRSAESDEAVLTSGVKVVWDLDKAHRHKTLTRERICLNGLFRWQPATEKAEAVPHDAWGFFKVPGFWPGLTSYIQEDSQTLFAHPNWKNADLRKLGAAWYQRECTIPADWVGRRITLAAEYVNSVVIVFLDGKKVGETRFPAGEVDLTTACKPGSKHTLSLLVLAVPLQGLLLSYNDTNAARQIKGSVERRGLCGDVWLVSTPLGPRITDLRAATSVRKGQLSLNTAFAGLDADRRYELHIQIREDDGQLVRELTSQIFQASDLKDGRLLVEPIAWLPKKLWDIHTPRHMHNARVTLAEANGRTLDTFDDVHFGFREFWIDGKDFYLNGTRIFLSAVPLDNAQIGARTASYDGALETMKRLKSFGINFVYTHNYGCQPGSHISFAEVLRAADDIGMLVGFSQPHFSHYDWKAAGAEGANGYAGHAAFYVQVAQNHPSVVAYSMSHNATGYDQDMNPDLIDGIHDRRTDSWSLNNSQLALRAEAIVKGLDPERIVYHHSSGNLGSMHTCNFYLNFAPIQEVSDWFEHWSAQGVKPMFPVEYGVPFSWDWTMYRGWYKGERNFGRAKVPWQFCLAEWNAQFLGERAYKISEREKQNLRFEAQQFKAGNLWHRWDYPHPVGSRDFDERAEIFARYITDNWRGFRALGLSANSPWEHAIYWKLKGGVNTGRRDFKVDWDKLQKPGFSADYTQRQSWQFVTDFDADDWVPTAAAQALMRNNRPFLAYIAGKSGAVTSRDHNYRPGDVVEKQLIIINNSRENVRGQYSYSLHLDQQGAGDSKSNILIETGEQQRLPLRFELPTTLTPGTYELSAKIRFSTGETQDDSFAIDVLPPAIAVPPRPRLALYDPKGGTSTLLERLGVPFQKVAEKADLAGYDTLIIGRDAFTADGAGPDALRVRDGLKVIVFEQKSQVLEQRFGFRVAEYGLREVFARVPDHPLLAGLRTEHLHDWRGEATLLPPRLDFTQRPRYGPTVKWCGIEVPHVWRCGCRGNVASVLLEKPARGDFLSIVDGGYALQYSPLLEYREGKGMVLFCQMDVTGRTDTDPAADTLVRNILRYASTWRPAPGRPAIYIGDPAGKRHLQAAGFTANAYSQELLRAGALVIVGPGGGKQLARDCPDIGKWIKSGGRLLALGLDEIDANAVLPAKVRMKKAEHIAAYFDALPCQSPLAGVAPADVHNRDPRLLDLVDDGATILGNGVLAHTSDGNVVFCQITPWQFDPTIALNLKRTFRRTSCTVTRLAANLGAVSETPILTRFANPAQKEERRWLSGLYLDVPEEWDDPYRFFRW
jgi:hypothetical protein